MATECNEAWPLSDNITRFAALSRVHTWFVLHATWPNGRVPRSATLIILCWSLESVEVSRCRTNIRIQTTLFYHCRSRLVSLYHSNMIKCPRFTSRLLSSEIQREGFHTIRRYTNIDRVQSFLSSASFHPSLLSCLVGWLFRGGWSLVLEQQDISEECILKLSDSDYVLWPQAWRTYR